MYTVHSQYYIGDDLIILSQTKYFGNGVEEKKKTQTEMSRKSRRSVKPSTSANILHKCQPVINY